MKRIRLHRHPQCARCAAIAKFHRRFDWFHRLEESTAVPPCGPLRKGEIAAVDLETGACVRGVDAAEQVFSVIPAYWLFRLLLRIPAVKRYAGRRMEQDCEGDACELPLRTIRHRS
jgi:hypothetical protein